jgi:hypothetical protein
MQEQNLAAGLVVFRFVALKIIAGWNIIEAIIVELMITLILSIG